MTPSSPIPLHQVGATTQQDAENLLMAAINNPQIGEGEQPTVEAPSVRPDPPDTIIQALRDLVNKVELQADVVRRWNVRRWRQAEEFWRNNQNLWWSESNWDWFSPVNSAIQPDQDLPRYDYVTNVYTAMGLSVVAAVSEKLPKVQFIPSSVVSEQDIATAKAANRIYEVFISNNDMEMERLYQAYLLWTQGSVAAYVRYVIDSSRFGESESQVFQQVTTELLPDRVDCQNCPAFTRISSMVPGMQTSCHNCGAPLDPNNYQPAEYMQAPVPVRTVKIPNGGEIVTSYGPLNFKVSPFVRDVRESTYLGLVEELDVGTLRATYPAKASQIRPGLSDGGTENGYEALARLSLMGSLGPSNVSPFIDLVSYRRFWLRPECFWKDDREDIRNQLLQMFPKGCFVAFAGETFLEARPECLDDHWRICHALPGQGMYRPGLGDSVIPIQEQINDVINLTAEQREYAAAPPILYDARYINGQALAQKRQEPGAYTPVLIEGGTAKPLADMIYQPRLGLDQNVYSSVPALLNLGQFVCGAQPSIIGMGQAHLDTAQAYAQAQTTALGRLELTWKQLKKFDAEVALLAVRTFQRNRTQDYEMVVEGKSAAFRSEFIRLGELQGSVVARPVSTEDFPTSFQEIRQAITQIIMSKQPDLMKLLMAPENIPNLMRYVGIPNIVSPDEDNRSKQAREIDALLMGKPTLQGDMWMPSVPTDMYVDDPDLHIEMIREWGVSDDGIAAKQTNPDGWDNVMAHLLMHEEDKVKIQQIMAQVQAMVQPAAPQQQTASPGAPDQQANPATGEGQ